LGNLLNVLDKLIDFDILILHRYMID
jgi:hypothetical protein